MGRELSLEPARQRLTRFLDALDQVDISLAIEAWSGGPFAAAPEHRAFAGAVRLVDLHLGEARIVLLFLCGKTLSIAVIGGDQIEVAVRRYRHAAAGKVHRIDQFQ